MMPTQILRFVDWSKTLKSQYLKNKIHIFQIKKINSVYINGYNMFSNTGRILTLIHKVRIIDDAIDF